MGPKKLSFGIGISSGEKSKKVILSLELKQELIEKRERNVHATGSRGDAGESSTNPSMEEFQASRGWFEKFKRRTGIRSIVQHGKALSSNTEAANDLVKKFEKILEDEGYVEQQVFNCDETGLEDDIIEQLKFIRVLYLPPNTTPILQRMELQVISNFNKLYTKHLFKQCFNVTQSTNIPLHEFWKSHLNIAHCLKVIVQAWEGVTRRALNSAWKKLWPDAASHRDFEGFGLERNPVLAVEEDVEEIVSLGKSMGLQVAEDDITKLVEEHHEEHTTEELKELPAMQNDEFKAQLRELEDIEEVEYI
ncbi:tigger transposable element-derived protein 1-like [Palaemon carinicauda]|uniref:tigger transposable element-derived protein 1-like n=1 Tax=Palaemon carinicauda TaxID=392227 RepID=UPI0035B5D9BC